MAGFQGSPGVGLTQGQPRAVPPSRGAPTPGDPSPSPAGKRKILGEAIATLSGDPLSVQFLAPWFRTLLPRHDPLADGLPWMTFRAIRWLRAYLDAGMDAFEYGTGGSTLFLASRVRTLVSIESDPAWHDRVARALRARGIGNCDLRLLPPEPAGPGGPAPYGPGSYTSTDPRHAGRTFRAYVESIDERPDGSLDLVSVDGFARAACIAHAIPKVRPGGYLLLDNSDWKVYRSGIALLEGFPRTDFPGVGPFQATGWRTSVWRL